MAQSGAISTSPTTLQFITDFRGLHDKLRNGTISLAERARYRAQRQQFARMMLLSQQIGMTGQTLRSELRMAKMLKVELRFDEGPPERLTTLEIATKGFATLVPMFLPVGSTCAFTLYLPKPAAPINGRAKVATVRAQGSVSKTSFVYDELLPDAVEQLDIALIDAVLERLVRFG